MDSQERSIVAATIIAQAVVFGATIASFSLLLRPLSEAFAASMFEIILGLSLLTMTLAACGIPVGTWLDRASASPCKSVRIRAHDTETCRPPSTSVASL